MKLVLQTPNEEERTTMLVIGARQLFEDRERDRGNPCAGQTQVLWVGIYSPAPSCFHQAAHTKRQKMGVCVDTGKGKQKAEGREKE